MSAAAIGAWIRSRPVVSTVIAGSSQVVSVGR